MDDSEAINPREAAAGLGLIGALMVALVGTFVYRTAMKPARPRPTAPAPALVNEGTPSNDVTQEPLAAGSLEPAPEVTPAPNFDEPVATPPVVPIEPGPSEADAESEAPPFQPEPMPRFVAPSSRANQ